MNKTPQDMIIENHDKANQLILFGISREIMNDMDCESLQECFDNIDEFKNLISSGNLSDDIYKNLSILYKITLIKNTLSIKHLLEETGYSLNDLLSIDLDIQFSILTQSWWISKLIHATGMSFDELLRLPEKVRLDIFENAWGVSELLDAGVSFDSLLQIDESVKELFFYNSIGLSIIIKKSDYSFQSLMCLPKNDLCIVFTNAWSIACLIDVGVDFNKIIQFDRVRRLIFFRHAAELLDLIENGSIDIDNIEHMIDKIYSDESDYQQSIKQHSEEIIKAMGGKVYDTLPSLQFTIEKPLYKIIQRASVLNAMIQLHFKAPKDYIRDWISDYNLNDALSDYECSVLFSEEPTLSDQESCNMYWRIEALWAIVWATKLIDQLPCDEGVGDELASLSPNLQEYEDVSKYSLEMELRSYEQLYAMRDLYYRLHYWLCHEKYNNPHINNPMLDVVIERRKALEWILSYDLDWDEMRFNENPILHRNDEHKPRLSLIKPSTQNDRKILIPASATLNKSSPFLMKRSGTNGIVDEYLDRLIKIYKEKKGRKLKFLSRASNHEIKLIKTNYPNVPDEFIDFISKTDGTAIDQDNFLYRPILFSVNSGNLTYSLYSLKEMIARLGDQSTLAETHPWFLEEGIDEDDSVTADIDLHAKMCDRILFADGGGCTDLYIDFKPTSLGKVGQIIAYVHDPDSYFVVCDSFADLLNVSINSAFEDFFHEDDVD